MVILGYKSKTSIKWLYSERHDMVYCRGHILVGNTFISKSKYIIFRYFGAWNNSTTYPHCAFSYGGLVLL